MVNRNENGQYACPQCNRRFAARSSMNAHLRREHGGQPLVCPAPGCGQECFDRTDLGRHRRDVHGKTSSVFVFFCTACQQDVGSRSDNRKRHVNKKHGGDGNVIQKLSRAEAVAQGLPLTLAASSGRRGRGQAQAPRPAAAPITVAGYVDSSDSTRYSPSNGDSNQNTPEENVAGILAAAVAAAPSLVAVSPAPYVVGPMSPVAATTGYTPVEQVAAWQQELESWQQLHQQNAAAREAFLNGGVVATQGDDDDVLPQLQPSEFDDGFEALGDDVQEELEEQQQPKQQQQGVIDPLLDDLFAAPSMDDPGMSFIEYFEREHDMYTMCKGSSLPQ